MIFRRMWKHSEKYSENRFAISDNFNANYEDKAHKLSLMIADDKTIQLATPM